MTLTRWGVDPIHTYKYLSGKVVVVSNVFVVYIFLIFEPGKLGKVNPV